MQFDFQAQQKFDFLLHFLNRVDQVGNKFLLLFLCVLGLIIAFVLLQHHWQKLIVENEAQKRKRKEVKKYGYRSNRNLADNSSR